MALDATSVDEMKRHYADGWRERATATMRTMMLVNRNYDSVFETNLEAVVQAPRMTNRLQRAQVSNADFRQFAGVFSEIESTPITLRLNRQYENQWQAPLDTAGPGVFSEVNALGQEEGLLTAQVLDHDILGYLVRGNATPTSADASPPGLISGANTKIATDNQFRYGADANYLPLNGNNAGNAQGASADQDMPLKALKRIQMAMMQNSQMNTGMKSYGRPMALMMPAHWRSITQTSEALNIENLRADIFAGRDVTPEGYAGTVYGIDCYLVNPAIPDGPNSGQAYYTTNQAAANVVAGTSISGTLTYDNPMMTRYAPADRSSTTANDLRNHGVILAGFPIATTFARAQELTKIFSPEQLQAADAYKGWQYSTSFRYLREVIEPRWLYMAEIQCAATNVNTGGG